MKNRFTKNRKIALDILGGKCNKCGEPRVELLDCDHVDPSSKEFQTSRIFYLGKERFLKELGKCQLLCKNCHTQKSIFDVGKLPAKGTHGTESSYRYCKCRVCKNAHNKEQNRRRKLKRPCNSNSESPAS